MSNLNPLQMLPVGTLLDGRYRIERYLASGGFGNTYVATDTKLDCRVAIKEFYLSQHSTRGADQCSVTVSTPEAQQLFDHYREKFKTEARRISKLRSDHIVRVSDLFEANGTSYYVMDFIEGQSLKNHFQKGHPLSEEKAVSICSQVLDALDVIHRAGLYHLDIKPDNIMLTPEGKAVLIDFGASKQMDAAGGITLNSQMVYTPGYAPSEQLDGKADRIGPWTDFYALGATLYATITGEKPPSPSDITDDGEEAFRFPTTTAPALIRCVSKMMSQSTKKRPQTIHDVRSLFSNRKQSSAEVVTVELEKEETQIQSQPHRPQPPSRDGFEGRVFTVGGISFKMIAVEGGSFMMGATPEQGNEAKFNEKPAHQVTLSRFSIGATTVTQALWKAVMGYNPAYNQGDDLPVERVSWNDCQAFIKKLNAATGQQFRLPTEAEWEFAARGGNQSKHTIYAGSNDIDAVAWYYGNSNTAKSWLGKAFSEGRTHPVAQKLPNELGIYDMSGNVWEWCQDWYDENYYDKSPSTDPCNNNKATRRLLRGGSWGFYAWDCRVSCRLCSSPVDTLSSLGFRLAL